MASTTVDNGVPTTTTTTTTATTTATHGATAEVSAAAAVSNTTPRSSPSTNTSDVAMVKQLLTTTHTINTVDSALLSAMRDPRERVALLKCEKVMMDFCKATDVQEIEVGGSYNSVIIGLSSSNNNNARQDVGRQTSFQRCWLHRLADRFNIARESMSPEWIRCKKTVNSAVPSQLLIDLKPSDYSLEDTTLLTTKMAGLNGTKKKRPPQKMKIMKRSSSSSLGSAQDQKGKPKATNNLGGCISEREKAYAEARARIFNDGAVDVAAAASTTIENNVEPPSPPNGTVGSPPPTTEDPQRFASWQVPAAVVGTTTMPAAVVGAAGNSKVTWRNRQQEENDPDFQRGGAVYYPAQPQQQAFAGYHPQQQQQQQHYQQQQQQHYQQQQQQQQQQAYYDSRYYSPTYNAQGGAGRGGRGYQDYRPKDTTSAEEFPALG